MSPIDGETAGLPIVSPANMLPVQVLRRAVTAPDVVTLYLVLPNTTQAPAPYLPGQFVTLALPTPRNTVYRSYSLCGDGHPDQPWEITIKRLHMGTVSTYLFDKVTEGSLLYASLPRGTFTLPEYIRPEMPLIFVAAGSGITPIMGMLSALTRLPLERRPQVQLHYASRSLSEMIYHRKLQQLDPHERWLRKWYYLSSDGNRLTPEAVLARVEAHLPIQQAHWYMCGPEVLKRDLQGLLEELELPDEQVHAEVFAVAAPRAQTGGTASALVGAGSGGSFRLQVAETGAMLDARANETLLAALERQGYRPDFSCRSGACGACKLRVLSGQVNPAGEALSAAERRAGYVLSCIAVPQGDVTLASGGRPPAGGVAPAAVPGAMPGWAMVARRTAVTRIRIASLLAAGALLLGAWTLTNHKPVTTQTAAAPPPGTTSTQPAVQGTTPSGAGAPATPTATPAGHTPQPTAAPGQKPPAPTATPKPPPPAPTPTPTTTSGTSHP